jgi:hypothetical protein
MDLEEIIGLLPEDKREGAKSELSAYVAIRAREDAERLAREHPHIKSVLDSGISRAVASHDERFLAEKLPGIVDQEIVKRNPPKDPRDAKLAEMEGKIKDMERMTALEKQTSRAVAKAAEKGIPVDLARKYAGMSDEETDQSIENLAALLLPWRDDAVKTVKIETYNTKAPKRGGDGGMSFDNMSFDQMMDYARSGPEAEAQVLAWQKSRKR